MRSGFVLALLLLAAPILGVGADGTVDVYFLDVGQGDAILIDMGELEVLIDGGPGAAVADLLMPYVDGALEMIFLTHAHTDHYGGLDDVLEHFQVLEVLTSQHHPSKTTYNAFLADVAAEGAIRTEVSRGDTVTIGGALLHVLHPLMIGSEENPNSLVLQLSYGEIDFLFTGDLEESAEHELVLAGVLQDIDILKVAHHGSRYGSTQAFLDLVKPEIAIYSAGAGNGYGHPHGETLQRLEATGAAVYGTDVCGTIRVSCTPSDYSIEPDCALATPETPASPEPISTASTLLITEVEVNPAGSDSGAEWIELFNPTSQPVALQGWAASYTGYGGGWDPIPSVTIGPGGYYRFVYPKQHLENSRGESIKLRDASGTVVDATPVGLSDERNDSRTWQRMRFSEGSGTLADWAFAQGTPGREN